VIVHHQTVDEIAAKIDFSLCDACGLLRLRDQDTMEDDLPRDVVAALIAQVRQDIGRLTQEHRHAVSTIEERVDEISKELRTLQRASDTADGQKQGVRLTLGVIVTLSTLLGGFIAWVLSHIPWTNQKP
jgi:ABC-type transporter Mla subunit MlaD